MYHPALTIVHTCIGSVEAVISKLDGLMQLMES